MMVQLKKDKLRSRLDEDGFFFWRDGYYLGSVLTTAYNKDATKKGLNFNLENDGSFMGVGISR